MHCLWNINAWKLRFEPNSYYPWKIRSHFLAIDSYTGGQSGCFARIIVGRAVWENNCSKVMVSAYSKPLNLWVIAMAFRWWLILKVGNVKRLQTLVCWLFDFHTLKDVWVTATGWHNFNQEAMEPSTLSDHQKDLDMWVMNYMFSRVTSSCNILKEVSLE